MNFPKFLFLPSHSYLPPFFLFLSERLGSKIWGGGGGGDHIKELTRQRGYLGNYVEHISRIMYVRFILFYYSDMVIYKVVQ